jgi:hypothetical protein
MPMPTTACDACRTLVLLPLASPALPAACVATWCTRARHCMCICTHVYMCIYAYAYAYEPLAVLGVACKCVRLDLGWPYQQSQ